jgi:hypothetical protein
MLKELISLTGSLTKSLDIFYVIKGLKKCSRILFNELKVDTNKERNTKKEIQLTESKNNELLLFLEENSIYYDFSDFKIITHIDKVRNYTDKGIKVPLTDKRSGQRFMYISKDKDLLKKAKQFEQENKNYELGRLLGYPQCCCKFFEKNIKEASKGTNDYSIFSLKESEGSNFSWLNNNLLRVFDISLLSHFPCTFDCKESKKIAEENFKAISEEDNKLSKKIKNTLSSLVIYSEGVGVYSITESKADSKNNKSFLYSPESIFSSSKGKFYDVLSSKNKITRIKKNNFLIDNVEINDDKTFLVKFS